MSITRTCTYQARPPRRQSVNKANAKYRHSVSERQFWLNKSEHHGQVKEPLLSLSTGGCGSLSRLPRIDTVLSKVADPWSVGARRRPLTSRVSSLLSLLGVSRDSRRASGLPQPRRRDCIVSYRCLMDLLRCFWRCGWEPGYKFCTTFAHRCSKDVASTSEAHISTLTSTLPRIDWPIVTPR